MCHTVVKLGCATQWLDLGVPHSGSTWMLLNDLILDFIILENISNYVNRRLICLVEILKKHLMQILLYEIKNALKYEMFHIFKKSKFLVSFALCGAAYSQRSPLCIPSNQVVGDKTSIQHKP